MEFSRTWYRTFLGDADLVLDHTKRVAIYLFSVHYPASHKAVLSARNLLQEAPRAVGASSAALEASEEALWVLRSD